MTTVSPNAPASTPPLDGTVDHEVTVIGAGFSGIGMAIALERAGLTDYLIVEEGEDFGGTWHWNRYTGVAVDIPSGRHDRPGGLLRSRRSTSGSAFAAPAEGATRRGR